MIINIESKICSITSHQALHVTRGAASCFRIVHILYPFNAQYFTDSAASGGECFIEAVC
jgi:hypothetical protein